MAELAAAIEGWREAVGDAHVATQPEVLRAYGTATFETSAGVLAVVRPADTEQVRRCLRVASATGVPVHPISRGRNWGYGSRVPPGGAAAVLELSRMKRILHLDEELGYVTVEPGVTFAQLHEFLAARGSGLVAGTIGGPVDASVIGNALERGLAAGAHGDTSRHVGSLEVVLSTGELLRTGFGSYAAAVAPYAREALGPGLDGLFFQSSFGVVTQLTLLLARAPAWSCRVDFGIDELERLPGLVDGLRGLVQRAVTTGPVFLWNDYKVATVEGRRPPCPPGQALPRARLVEAMGGEPPPLWSGSLEIHGASRAEGWARELLARNVLRRSGAVSWRAEADSEAGGGATSFQRGVRGRLRAWIRGARPAPRPTNRIVSSAYWRKPGPRPLPADVDLDRDGCGVVWLCPSVPMRGADVAQVVEVLEASLLAAGFEPPLSLGFYDGRVTHVLCPILFDREAAGEDGRALECFHHTSASLEERDYIPYRLGIGPAQRPPAPSDDSPQVLQRLKKTLDPADVVAPGRYDQRAFWSRG